MKLQVSKFKAKGWVRSDKHPNVIIKSNGESGFLPFCNDCGMVQPADYMIEDYIWETVASKKGCILCVDCVSTRLGRKLRLSDFTNVPVNKLLFLGYSLRTTEEEDNVECN